MPETIAPGISQPSPADNWYGVTDLKKRKQIQDRLAQRARRKRLAAVGENPRRKQPSKVRQPPHDRRSEISKPSLSDSPEPLPKCSPTCRRPPEATFLSAMFDNGQILGIACGTSFPSKSKQPGPDVPISLQPTILQLSTVHWQWIDRFPFPEVRDEIIIQSGNFDEEEFLYDIFHMDTFTMRQGAEPWDPSAFTICPGFKAKWGFLFPNFSADTLNTSSSSSSESGTNEQIF